MDNGNKSTKFGNTAKNNGNSANAKGVVSKGKGTKINNRGMQGNKTPNNAIPNSSRIKWS